MLQLDCPDLALSRHIRDMDSKVVWLKLQALTEGAKLASQKLW